MFKLPRFLSSRRTFVDDVLAGKALLTDIDDYVDRWHEAPDDSRESSMQLHEYLGLTWDDYRLWVERPESLRHILASRKQGLPVAQILARISPVAAAARSTEQSEAAKTLAWLRDRGRL